MMENFRKYFDKKLGESLVINRNTAHDKFFEFNI